MKTLDAADLFCGAGGTSTGLMKAADELGIKVQLRAVNHSTVAIRTHSINHPDARHYCDEMENALPRFLVRDGRLFLLVGSPECIFFSKARGGKPLNEQSRASVRYVLQWVRDLHVENVLIENVEEFVEWGPLLSCDCGAGDASGEHAKGCTFNRPDPARKGEYFRQFVAELKDEGYIVEWRVLTCADYGDATTRRRFFLQAKKGLGRAITWPAPTHAPRKEAARLGRREWRSAGEIIDWSIPGTSIYHREKPLAENTMRRIYAGLRKFCGLDFVIGQQSGAAPRSVSDPLPTIATAGKIAFVQPYLVILRNHQDSASLAEPAPTITASGLHLGVAEPFIVPVRHHGGPERAYPVSSPLPTITCARRGEMAICRPFLTKYHGSHVGKSDGDGRVLSIDDPSPTLDTSNRLGLAQPYLVVNRTHATPLSLEDPLRTLTTGGNFGLCEPYLVSYYGTGGPRSLGDPLDTVTTRDRFALVSPELVIDGTFDNGDIIGWLDVLFRMLRPHELAGAHSFPRKYFFFGTQEMQVRQIGNSVPVETAKALCLEIFRDAPFATPHNYLQEIIA